MRDHKQRDEASSHAGADASHAPGKQSLTEQIDRAGPVTGPGKQTLTAQIQRKAGGQAGGAIGASAQDVAAHGTSGSAQALPHGDRIQHAFGRHDVSGIRAFVGGPAQEASQALGAQAYATGSSVAFGAAPDLHTAAHEAAHVVQQRGGVQLKDGLGQSGDHYEHHADAVADRVVRGESAEDLLDQHAGAHGSAPAGTGAIQRLAPTHYGQFKAPTYDPVGAAGSEYGLDIKLEFHPGNNVDATKIALTQQVRTQLGNKAIAIDPGRHGRIVPSGVGEGSEIDRVSDRPNPIYGGAPPTSGSDIAKTPVSSSNMHAGFRFMTGTTEHKQEAMLTDRPTQPGRGNDSSQVFETAALALEGRQQGSYLGTVQWGWQVDGAGKFKKLELTVKSDDVPTDGFMAAAKQWNSSHALGTVKAALEPTKVYDDAFAEAFSVAKDTEIEVTQLGNLIQNNISYNPVRIKSGPQIGKLGQIKTNEMKDLGDGAAHLQLPVQGIGTIVAAKTGTPAVHEAGSETAAVLAELPVGARIKIMTDAGDWLKVEVDTTQAGVVVKSTDAKVLDAAKMLRGHVHKDLIKR
jgi:Domain of unknown function (DUF4157)